MPGSLSLCGGSKEVVAIWSIVRFLDLLGILAVFACSLLTGGYANRSCIHDASPVPPFLLTPPDALFPSSISLSPSPSPSLLHFSLWFVLGTELLCAASCSCTFLLCNFFFFRLSEWVWVWLIHLPWDVGKPDLASWTLLPQSRLVIFSVGQATLLLQLSSAPKGISGKTLLGIFLTFLLSLLFHCKYLLIKQWHSLRFERLILASVERAQRD